jgi:hypothetical protein
VYVKASSRKTKDGQVIRYLQLAHNEWDGQAGVSRTKVLHSFGREDELDREGIKRLVAALSRLLDPADALAATSGGELTMTSSRPIGGTYALDQLWRRLGLDTVIRRQLAGRKLDPRVERVLFALVANRALAASSKLAATGWIADDVHIEGLDEINEQSCYRAMDYLLTIEPDLAKEAYIQVTDLLNLEVDLLFFDTTSTYFETGEADDPVPRDQDGHRVEAEDGAAVKNTGFRTHGKSKDSRDDLPQVVVGMAVTRDGIPVRVWSWPGNTTDTDLIRQVRDDIREWTLSRIVWVADRGFTSQKNRRALMRGGGGYIIGEKLRSGSDEVKAALSRQGRYATVTDNMQVKEVNIGTDDRFVLCYNPAQAERDATVRTLLVNKLQEAIAGTDKLSSTERARIEGSLTGKPGLKRFLRVTPGGLLRIDKQKIKTEENLDGKYLLRCSDPNLSAEDIARGYKQLLEVERGWRDMKQILDLRPVYHRREDRIRAHVLLCWLALLLIRVAEVTAGRSWTWQQIRADLQRLHAITYTGPAGTFRQTTEPTKPQRDALTALGLDPPKKIIEISPKS